MCFSSVEHHAGLNCPQLSDKDFIQKTSLVPQAMTLSVCTRVGAE